MPEQWQPAAVHHRTAGWDNGGSALAPTGSAAAELFRAPVSLLELNWQHARFPERLNWEVT